MSKLTQIEQALIAMDPAAFHRLCDSYLYKLGFININRIGLVAGAEKDITGTPDTFFPRPDGTYVFAEYSTQQKGLVGKFKGDLANCFNEAKTGIPVGQIDEIVLCHNSKLDPEDDFALGEECRSKKTRLSIFGLTRIAHDLYQRYPGLAKEFLRIEIDTGQVLSIDDFVAEYGKNRFATPLDTAFQSREDELELITQALDEIDLVFVTGKTGLGKTRLALEACRQYREDHSDVQIHCILNKGIDVFEDLRSTFSAPGHHLILVDDTNRVNRFDYALQLLHDRRPDQTIKIIATVRDYALDAAQKAARPFSDSKLIELHSFNDDQIKELVKREYGITNFHYLDRIADIAKGNPRLAVMAAQVAKRENRLDSIADVSALYDEYFASIQDDLKELGQPNLILVAGIISFFRTIDRNNTELMGKIEAAFGLRSEAFWTAANRLHELEIVDMYEREVVRISDQVLSTYLFYLAVFRERALDFAVLLEEFFPNLRHRMTDALYPVLNAFDSESITTALRPHVDRALTIFQQRGDEAALLHLLDVFWFVKPTDTLIYLRHSIRNLYANSPSPTDPRFRVSTTLPETPSILAVLDNFRYTEEASIKSALSLICDYLEKRPAEVPLILRMLTERYGMTHRSDLNKFTVERLVVDELWKRSRSGQNEFFARMFLAVVEPLLHTHFHATEQRSRMSVSIIKFDVPNTTELIEFRKLLWGRVFSLWTLPNLQEHVLEFLEKHSGSGFLVAHREIVTSDAQLVLTFFTSSLDASVYRHCLIVHNYLEMLERLGVEYEPHLRDRFTNETYALSDLLFLDRREQRELGWREYEKLRHDRLSEYTADYDAGAFSVFFDRCAEIIRTSDGRQFQYQVQQGASFVLLKLADRNPDLFTIVVTNYLQNGEVLQLFPGQIVEKLIKTAGVKHVYEILSASNHAQKSNWLFAYFVVLPTDAVTKDRLQVLYDLYQTATHEQVVRNFDYLLKFLPLDRSGLIRVVETLVNRAVKEQLFGCPLTELFNQHSEIGQNLGKYFAYNLELLQRAYFASWQADNHHDYDGTFFNKLIDLNPTFPQNWISWFFAHTNWPSSRDDSRDYSFLWRRTDYTPVMEIIVNAIRDNVRDRVLLSSSYLQNFFVMTDGLEDREEIYACQDAFCDQMIRKHSNDPELMGLLFEVISGFSAERRRERLNQFVQCNQDPNAFEHLPLFSSWWESTGSAVPILQKRVEFLESLIPLVDTVDLLNHKQRIEHEIQTLREDIEREKRREFMRDE
jgi:hypothetical protein